jgi:hypothetical protein
VCSLHVLGFSALPQKLAIFAFGHLKFFCIYILMSVIIKTYGGLGNQIFQLAAAYTYAEINNLKLVISTERLSTDRPTYWDSYLSFFNAYLYNGDITDAVEWIQPGNKSTTFVQIPTKYHNILLEGYFQSYKYFAPMADKIRNLFRTPDTSVSILWNKFGWLLRKREDVVVVHARRGDYCKSEGMRNFHGPLDRFYYEHAISRIGKSNTYYLLV